MAKVQERRQSKPGDVTAGWGALVTLVGVAVMFVAVLATPDGPYSDPPAVLAGVGRLLFFGGAATIAVGLLMRLVHHASR